MFERNKRININLLTQSEGEEEEKRREKKEMNLQKKRHEMNEAGSLKFTRRKKLRKIQADLFQAQDLVHVSLLRILSVKEARPKGLKERSDIHDYLMTPFSNGCDLITKPGVLLLLMTLNDATTCLPF